MEAALALVREQSCQVVLTTGVDVPNGKYLSEHGTYAHLGEATLEALGIPPDQVHPAPAGA
ncbi:MAG: YdcF family protein, partial [Akkermansiaceae bacterium]|nr:YdcF family protein [Akkermansiaceae bacterium]